ncbi:hypothetical protein FS837_001780 [Tulasnella sp. UAMH 9824]|nr:hypothetical protein FS837_001780 [Tulasnella sp. UAMH 9824]
MSYYPTKNNQLPKRLASRFPPTPMNPEQRAAYESDCRVDWSNTFGASSSRPPFYGQPNQPPIPWDQLPALAGPSNSAAPPVPPQQPSPSTRIPPRARSRPSQPGENVFQVDVSSSSTASSSTWQQPPPPPVQGRYSLNPPPPTPCRCMIQFESQSRRIRHWTHSCPDNPDLASYECDECGKVIGRKDNLKRHMEKNHSRRSS